MMKTVYVFVGVSGSGKSTFAAAYQKMYPRTAIVSSDAVRKELWGDEADQQRQDVVWNRVYDYLLAAIKDDGNDAVILDATNLGRENRKELVYYIHTNGAAAKAVIFTTPKDLCVERDAARDRTVGKAVIEKQLKKYDQISSSEGFDGIYEWGEEGWKIVV